MFLAFVLGKWGLAVRKENDHLCMMCCLQAALDAHLFDDIIRLPDSCGVDEAEGMVADGECGINGVARSALNVADNGSVVVDDGIEECALSDIGSSDDGYSNAVLDGIAYGKAARQTINRRDKEVSLGRKFGTVSKLQIFMVREIEFQLKERGQLQ